MGLRVGVLGSTRGTALQGVLDAVAAGTLDVEIVLVVSDKVDAPILERARRYELRAEFFDPAGLKRQLFEKGRQIQLESRVRAEADIAVAAASILARAEFLRRLKTLGEPFGIDLPKGASSIVLDVGVRFVKQHGADHLAEVAKMHFKTAIEVMRRAGS